MIRLNVTVEGFSEERFVKDVLSPHLVTFGIAVYVRKVLTNRKLRKRGGIVSFGKFKNDVMQWVKEQPQAYHTTFIDFYGLKADFPFCNQSDPADPYKKVKLIEGGIRTEISHHRFIPFVQLHEFEGLLFADTHETEKWLSLDNILRPGTLEEIRSSCGGNPELINGGAETAPSKRILSLCPGYDKVGDGVLILKEIGLSKLRSECRHFDEWVTTLERIQAH